MHALSLSLPVSVGRTRHERHHRRARHQIGARLLSCRAGSVAMEFALVLPVLILLMLASVELARFVFLHQKMDRVATTISDLVARAETINESQLADIFTAAGEVSTPFDLANRGVVIVSSVTNLDGEGAKIAWQRAGAGSYSAASELGAEGEIPNLPAEFEVRDGESAIISEVYFDFAPFLSELIVAPQLIYRTAHQRPRLGTLEEIDEG